MRAIAYYNVGSEIRQFVDRNPIALGRHSISARAGLERRTVHVADIQEDPDHAYVVRDVDLIRTLLAVPMLKGDELLGIITIYRLEVKPFADKQVELVKPLPPKLSSQSRIPGCSMSCGNPCSNRLLPLTC